MDKKYIDQAGKYVCIVKEPGNGWLDKPEGKAPFIRIPCIVDMPESDQHGHEAVWYGYLTEKSRARTEETLKKVFGWDGDWEDESKLDLFIGQKVRLQCDESEWQGKQQIKARWLNPYTTKREKNRAEYDAKRAAVMEELRKEYPMLAKVKPKKKEQAPHVMKTHEDDGTEIPF